MRFLLSCIAILATLLANFLSFAQACSLLEFILCCPQDAYEAPDDIVLFCTESKVLPVHGSVRYVQMSSIYIYFTLHAANSCAELGDEPCPDVEDIIWCCAAFDVSLARSPSFGNTGMQY